MNTRYLILATLAMALLAVSCQKTAVGGAQELEEAPVPIQLTTNLKVNSVSVTKAAVEAWDATKHTLYIYALPTNEILVENDPNILINNAPVKAPQNGSTDPYGKKDITLYENPENLTFYYYPADKTTLDFYGYYVGDAFIDPTLPEGNVPTKPDPTITPNDNISLKLYLDGSQDIMLAKPDKEEDVKNEQGELIIAPANAYSAYSARKNVKPNLKFEHQLSRFVFNVVAGNDEGKKVKIKGVTLTSNNQAELVIAAKNNGQRGIKNPSVVGTFELKDKDGNKVTSWFPEHIVASGQSYDFGSNDQVGESIMVIPSNSHHLEITMCQTDGLDDTATELGGDFKYVHDLDIGMIENPVQAQGEEFLPGYQYNVNVVVYGREKVLVTVQLTQWASGGSIEIDNDKEWGDEPKLGYKATNSTGAEYYLYFYGTPIVAEEGETPGTEVKYWDKNANKMVAPETGTYMFVTPVTGTSPIYGVALTKTGDGENAKTTVTALVTEAPTPPTE